MLTDAEIDKIAEEFEEYVNDAYCTGVSEVVRTADTVENFKQNLHSYSHVDTDDETNDGRPITIIFKVQAFKGDSRKDLYIIEIEDNVRLVAVV